MLHPVAVGHDQMEMIRITQWLCPMRHCIIALAWDPKRTTEAEMVERGEGYFQSGAVLRKCGICGSDIIRHETGVTKFATMQEAHPHLKVIERANKAAMQMFRERKN